MRFFKLFGVIIFFSLTLEVVHVSNTLHILLNRKEIACCCLRLWRGRRISRRHGGSKAFSRRIFAMALEFLTPSLFRPRFCRVGNSRAWNANVN